MLFLPKCYKRLEQESSLLKNSGWCKENKKKLIHFSQFTKEKRKKTVFKFIWKLAIFLIIIPYYFSPTAFVTALHQLFLKALIIKISFSKNLYSFSWGSENKH